MRDHLRAELATSALMMAVQRQRPTAGLVQHPDRGIQYACTDDQGMLAGAGITPSMSRRGNALDNAPMESFLHTLETELVHHRAYATRDEAKRDAPLDLVLDDPASDGSQCFVIDLFAPEGSRPHTLGASLSRATDLMFGNQTRRLREGQEREQRAARRDRSPPRGAAARTARPAGHRDDARRGPPAADGDALSQLPRRA